MIDSDLYSSAREALAFCAPLIQDDAIIFFDDLTEAGWEGLEGERQAFREFLEAHPEFGAVQLESYSPWTATFLLTRRVVQISHSARAMGRPAPAGLRPAQPGP